MSSLTGCATASSKDSRSLIAPDVIQYSQKQLNTAVKEMRTYPIPQVTEMMKDYCIMRDQSRIMQGKKPVCIVKFGKSFKKYPRIN